MARGLLRVRAKEIPMPVHVSTHLHSLTRGRAASAVFGLVCLSAGCGDATHGGAAPDAVPPGAEIGYLTGAVSGLEFETETVSGVTNEYGAFFYESGQVVRFRLGDIVFGEAEGANMVSPFDLAGIEPITNGRKGVEDAGLAFDRVANMLIVLETFDYDGDPSNGIEITADVADVFEGAELGLEKHPWWFKNDLGFRGALNVANSESLLADHRAPRGPAPALNRLYQELGLDAGYYAAAAYERDDGYDGVIDSRNELEFDVDGFPTRSVITDATHDDYVTVYEVTDWGELRSWVQGAGAGRVADVSTTATFDSDGNMIREEIDSNGDERPDRLIVNVYDEFGRVVTRREDRDGDDVWDSIEHQSYDDDERSSTRREDLDADGVIDRIVVRHYTANQRILSRGYDDDGDGSMDSVVRHRYDERGNEIAVWSDSNGDGIVDSVRRTEYDDDGRRRRDIEDHNDDGIPNSVSTHSYDRQGRPVAVERDTNADGTIDSVTTYQYDEAEGLPVGVRGTAIERDDDNDGVLDSRIVQIFDENDSLVLTISDHDGDGVRDQSTRLTPVRVGWGYYFWD